MKFSSCLTLALTTSLTNDVFGGIRGAENGNGNQPGRVFDCELGCDLDEVGQGPPVCGTDDVTYFNECLAVCQGVEVARPGVCPRDPPIRANDDSYVRQGHVSKADMDAFKTERLKFAVLRKINKDLAPNSERAEHAGPGNDPVEVPSKIKVKRITQDGYEYAAMISFSNLPEGTETEPTDGELGRNPDPHGRLLTVLGTDTRTETSGFSYPNWRLGELDYRWNNVGLCSGAVIASNAVLTAGHCVFDDDTSQWMVPNRVAPGRYRSGSTSYDPWGHWAVNTATIYTVYYDSGNWNYDVAVLTMGSGSAFSTHIGDYMGTLGMKTQPCSFTESAMRITGYPGDKPDGSLWTTGVCDDWSYSCGSQKIYHKCDTAGGMSGSAVRDGSNYIVSVHTHGVGSNGFNSAKAITSSDLAALRSWAGL